MGHYQFEKLKVKRTVVSSPEQTKEPIFAYAEEKLANAVYGLTTGEGNIRQRLAEISLDIFILFENDFPIEMQDDFIWIKNELTKKGPIIIGDKLIIGSVHNTMKHIRNVTASKIAKKIFNLYCNLRTYNDNKVKPLKDLTSLLI